MKSFLGNLFLALLGLVGGLLLPRPEILEKNLPTQLQRKPLTVEKLPSRWENALPQGFNVDETKVKDDLIGKKVYVRGDKPWTVSKDAKVEILNKRSIYDDKVDVFVQLEDHHWYGLMQHRGEKMVGMLRIEYDVVIRKSDGKRIWYVISTSDLTLKTSAAERQGRKIQHPPEKLPQPKSE